MTPNGSKRDSMKIRREWVARLLLRGMSQREIGVALGLPEPGGPGIKASAATVNTDIKALRKVWQERANQNIEIWMGDELAKLDTLERQAWTSKKLDLVLKIMNRRSKMLGIDAPDRIDHTSKGEKVDIAVWQSDRNKRLKAVEDEMPTPGIKD